MTRPATCRWRSKTRVRASTPELHADIFTPFMRGDGSRSRQGGGSGLGLAVAIADAHGGRVYHRAAPAAASSSNCRASSRAGCLRAGVHRVRPDWRRSHPFPRVGDRQLLAQLDAQCLPRRDRLRTGSGHGRGQQRLLVAQRQSASSCSSVPGRSHCPLCSSNPRRLRVSALSGAASSCRLSTSRVRAAGARLFQQQQAGTGAGPCSSHGALLCRQLQPAAHITSGQASWAAATCEQLLVVVARRGEVVALRLRCSAVRQYPLVEHVQPHQSPLQAARAQLARPASPRRGTRPAAAWRFPPRSCC